MHNFRGLLEIRRIVRMPNARVREMYGEKNEAGERIGGGVFSGSAKLLKEWRVVGLKK